MLEKPVNKFEISIVIILQLIIMVFLYIALKPPKQNAEADELLFQFQFTQRAHQLLQEYSEKAELLSKERQHKEAAILLLQEAAARECLFPEQRSVSYSQPTISETMALVLFRQASLNGDEMGNKGEEAYKQILQLKYPDWTE